MNKQEVAILLTGIASVDDRFDPDEARIEAWSAILDNDMTLEFARLLMIKHYANNTKPVMPADFNSPWRTFRERNKDQQWFVQIENQRKELTPEIKDIIQKGKAELLAKRYKEASENAPAEKL
jgi:hypothetical protein